MLTTFDEDHDNDGYYGDPWILQHSYLDGSTPKDTMFPFCRWYSDETENA